MKVMSRDVAVKFLKPASLRLWNPLPSRPDRPRRSGLQDAAEGGAFHVARRAAGSGVPQAVAHDAQFVDRHVQLLRLGREHQPVDARPPVRGEHARDLIKRKTGGAPQRNQRQPFQHAGVEQTAQALPADRGDQTFFFIEPQRRGRNAGTLRHLAYVQVFHPLDLKST